MMQELVQQIEDTIRNAANDMHTAMPGVILAYDAGSGMAEVAPVGELQMPDGKTLKYPSISGVPVIFPQGNGQMATITYPVKEGDGCLLIICENDIRSWKDETEGDDGRMKFDLTNAVCIPGMFREGSEAAQMAADEDAIVIKNGDNTIIMKQDELSIELGGSSFLLNETGVTIRSQGKSIVMNGSGIKIDGNLHVSGTITEG